MIYTTPVPIVGEKYFYRGDSKKQIFILKEHTEYVFRFECGHWCTDNVFYNSIEPLTKQLPLTFES